MKDKLCAIFGIIGGLISSLFGGWSGSLTTLVIFMAVDYISGLVVAGVFHKSKKSHSGALSSIAGWKGLCRKCMSLLFVLVGYRLDLVLGTGYIRDALVIGFVSNELISIVENAGLMGLQLPGVVQQAIELLRGKSGEDDPAEEPETPEAPEEKETEDTDEG